MLEYQSKGARGGEGRGGEGATIRCGRAPHNAPPPLPFLPTWFASKKASVPPRSFLVSRSSSDPSSSDCQLWSSWVTRYRAKKET
eukprot:scaffold13492_cov57-Isochrysis_galbana.AAC.1